MTSSIHPSAIVSPEAVVGSDVEIGPFTLVHENVVIGDGSRVGSHCEIGHRTGAPDSGPLVIGKNSTIRSHSVFYEGSNFGDGLTTGHSVTVRENVSAGLSLQIGTLSDLEGYIAIGDYVRTHSNVHIGQQSVIGNFVWIFPYVVLTNDPQPPSNLGLQGVKIEDYAVLATMSTVLPGVIIGTRSVVAAHALVRNNVEPDTLVAGVPAKSLGAANRIQLRDGSGPAYPWMRHFQKGYPKNVTEEWSVKYP